MAPSPIFGTPDTAAAACRRSFGLICSWGWPPLLVATSHVAGTYRLRSGHPVNTFQTHIRSLLWILFDVIFFVFFFTFVFFCCSSFDLVRKLVACPLPHWARHCLAIFYSMGDCPLPNLLIHMPLGWIDQPYRSRDRGIWSLTRHNQFRSHPWVCSVLLTTMPRPKRPRPRCYVVNATKVASQPKPELPGSSQQRERESERELPRETTPSQ